MESGVESHLEALSKDKQEMMRGLRCTHGNKQESYLKAGISGIQRKVHSCRGQGRVGIDNKPHGMWFRQKDENMAYVSAFPQRRKQRRERSWGKG